MLFLLLTHHKKKQCISSASLTDIVTDWAPNDENKEPSNLLEIIIGNDLSFQYSILNLLASMNEYNKSVPSALETHKPDSSMNFLSFLVCTNIEKTLV